MSRLVGVLSGLGHGRLLLEKSAHKSGVLTAMQDASVVHLACHGDMLTDSLLMAQEDGGASGHSVLQCVAVCCNVLQCVAVWCSVLRCVAVSCSVDCFVSEGAGGGW